MHLHKPHFPRLAKRLRNWVDRMDPDGAPRGLNLWFTYERGYGPVLRTDKRGCRLWYLGQESYALAHVQANNPTLPFMVVVDEMAELLRMTEDKK